MSGPALEMPPVGEPDAALRRIQSDIEIRYAASIVNVNLSKNDAAVNLLHLLERFQLVS